MSEHTGGTNVENATMVRVRKKNRHCYGLPAVRLEPFDTDVSGCLVATMELHT